MMVKNLEFTSEIPSPVESASGRWGRRLRLGLGSQADYFQAEEPNRLLREKGLAAAFQTAEQHNNPVTAGSSAGLSPGLP